MGLTEAVSSILYASERPAQQPAFHHLSRVPLGSDKIRDPWVTLGPLKPPHFSLVVSKFTNKLLKPRVTDAKLPSPGTTGRPIFVPGGEPKKCEPPDHLGFFFASPGQGWAVSGAGPRLREVSHGSVI